jgi:hypothetical protein
MLLANTNTKKDNSQQHVSSIRQLKTNYLLMKTENNNNRPDDFPEIGKKLPYDVPEGFFDQISERTLLESKTRSAGSKRLLLWYSGVAASLLALALVGYWGFQRTPSVEVVVENKQVTAPVVFEKPQVSEVAQPEVKPEKKVEQVPVQKVVEENNESIADILAELTEEELMQLDADVQSDPFMEEFEMN